MSSQELSERDLFLWHLGEVVGGPRGSNVAPFWGSHVTFPKDSGCLQGI